VRTNVSKKKPALVQSLADSGQMLFWANERQTAELCGLNAKEFARRRPELEEAGLPLPSSLNGKRFIPSVLAFLDGMVSKPKAHREDDIQSLPESDQRRLLECFGSPEEISVKRKYAHLVCTFGHWDGQPAVRYSFGDNPVRAAMLDASGEWTEITLAEFRMNVKRLEYSYYVARFAPLPLLPNWLFQRPQRRPRRKMRPALQASH